jgi:hypothetical protein
MEKVDFSPMKINVPYFIYAPKKYGDIISPHFIQENNKMVFVVPCKCCGSWIKLPSDNLDYCDAICQNANISNPLAMDISYHAILATLHNFTIMQTKNILNN